MLKELLTSSIPMKESQGFFGGGVAGHILRQLLSNYLYVGKRNTGAITTKYSRFSVCLISTGCLTWLSSIAPRLQTWSGRCGWSLQALKWELVLSCVLFKSIWCSVLKMFFKKHLFIYWLCGCMCNTAHMWQSVQEWILVYHPHGRSCGTQVIRLGSKHLLLWSYFTSPHLAVFVDHC